MAFLYLLLQVVFSSAFTLVIKWSQNRGRDDIVTIGAVNYIVAAIAILPQFLQNTPENDPTTAALLGGTMGAVYFTAFFFVIFAIRHVGASPTTVVSVLSMIVPIAFAAFLWDEKPNATQVVGICLALMALSMIGGKGKDKPDPFPTRPWLVPLILISFFAFCGISRLTQEAFKHLCESDQRPTFLMSTFAVASLPSAAILIYRWKQIRKQEVFFGVALGIANILQSFFILKALQYFTGFFVFPVTSAGAVALTTLVATMLLGEKLTRRTQVGIGIAIVALFLL